MFQQGSIKSNDIATEAQADQWLVCHLEAVTRHIQTKLVRNYRLSGDDLEEMTSRAILETVEQVRKKAFVPDIMGGWGDDPVTILKQLKARLNYFIQDEMEAFKRLSSGRRVTDFYDAATRQPSRVEDDEGNNVGSPREADIWDVQLPSPYDTLNSYAPSPEETLLHKEVWSIAEGCCEDSEDDILLAVILGDLSLTQASKVLDTPISTLSKRKNALIIRIKSELEEAGYAR